MVNTKELIQKDLQHIWHPCTQMKDFEDFSPLVVHGAKGNYLYTDQGQLIDGISSWWCKSLGHGHPNVIAAIKKQLDQFEHVISANTTHPLAVELAETLRTITGKQHSFYASDGSSAIEIAMKLAIHATQLKGYNTKNKFVSLKNGYHGETLGTLAVSDLGLFKAPYQSFGINSYIINEVPYVVNGEDPYWNNCDNHWAIIEKELDTISDQVCAIIFEPIVQGAGGMLCYSQDLLRKLSLWASKNDVFLIADEIMTGIGRTGEWLACQHAQVEPDILCLSKGLTSGSIPFSCVMIDHDIFDLFYNDYDAKKSFLHSHTYSGNPLGVAAALATIHTIQNENLLDHAKNIGSMMFKQMQQIAQISGCLTNVRGIGAITAADLVDPPKQRMGYEIYKTAISMGALIRPLGNTVYWLPPLNTNEEIIMNLAEITLNSILEAYNTNRK
ncbi:adenosylmethionine--8-amino-7-oxononanoate transaminase [Legionella waltersii]|uniref:Adenosylmethionine-8-amino-7-oxononanoate aminotransferase n=1 Tax=Legionella waltersii TaxID=66969 RepID=A0A0W1A1B5_9GAMM|nr:adenosylmethionine--8-amino-7-oxononanoate transaminase [Legionella waltersii]KTD75124.1 adenosylmethionine-8-amino-7-oxononanoate aminotransferase [Legionella waltersii]SNV04950.1 adenosylmethionine-8-amino-7-oxononanoate aminotransferase [Legionella waltersii]